MKVLVNFRVSILIALLVYSSSYISASQLDSRAGSLPLQSYALQSPEADNLKRQTPLLAQHADAYSLEPDQEINVATPMQDYRKKLKQCVCSIVVSGGTSTLLSVITFMGATTDDFGQTAAILWCGLYGSLAVSTALYSGYHCVKLGRLCCQRKDHL